MKDKILQIISDKPKHYTVIIKKNTELHHWVMENSLANVDHYPTMIYSAVHGESNVCKYGNKKSISRFSEGWVGCGPANVCQCTRESIAVSVSKTKIEQSPEIKQKIENKRMNTMLKKYGVPYNSQRECIKQILTKPKITPEAYSLLNDKSWLFEEYINKGRSLVDLAQQLGVYYSTVGEYCRKHDFKIRQRTNYSLQEREICDFLDELPIPYMSNDWDILGDKELDIYIPSHKIGIEINGLYWHSYNPTCNHSPKIENKFRHKEKKSAAKNAGIDLLQFTDYEINNKKDIVKSIIKTRIGSSKKLYARNLVIRSVPKNIEKEFLEKNHLQGFSPSGECIGLFSGDELFMLMSFSKPRYSKTADLELLRLCTKLGHVVIGGAKKLFNEIKKRHAGKTIVSYCDMSKFNGNVYESLGFISDKEAQPGYFWTDGNIVISRQKCQKHNLKKWLVSFDEDKSEAENMFAAGYRRYWDCGQQTWIFKI